jgi:hypothetical protein
MDLGAKRENVVLYLIQSVLIVCKYDENTIPINIICLEGLAANPIFNN